MIPNRQTGGSMSGRTRQPWRVHRFSKSGALTACGTALAACALAVYGVHRMQAEERAALRRGIERDRLLLAAKRAERGLPQLPER